MSGVFTNLSMLIDSHTQTAGNRKLCHDVQSMWLLGLNHFRFHMTISRLIAHGMVMMEVVNHFHRNKKGIN